MGHCRLGADHLAGSPRRADRASPAKRSAEPSRTATVDHICYPFGPITGRQILLQMRVGEKTNEIPVAYFLLPCLPVAGRVYTADALHPHVPLLELIWMLGGYVVLVVKDNQPTLLADLATYFAD